MTGKGIILLAVRSTTGVDQNIKKKMRKVNSFRNLNKMQKTIKEERQKRTSQQGISTRNGT